MTAKNRAHGKGAFFLLALAMLFGYIGQISAQEIKPGDMVPNIISESYNGKRWEPFELYNYFNSKWKKGMKGDWIALDFIDTDCPACIRAAGKVDKWSKTFSSKNKKWAGPNVRFIAIATSLDIAGHDSSRSEIEAFRDKTPGEDCAGSDCSSRSGKKHIFPYVDDIEGKDFENFGVFSTPSYMLIQPDGRLAWYSGDKKSKGNLEDAIKKFTLPKK